MCLDISFILRGVVEQYAMISKLSGLASIDNNFMILSLFFILYNKT